MHVYSTCYGKLGNSSWNSVKDPCRFPHLLGWPPHGRHTLQGTNPSLIASSRVLR